MGSARSTPPHSGKNSPCSAARPSVRRRGPKRPRATPAPAWSGERRRPSRRATDGSDPVAGGSCRTATARSSRSARRLGGTRSGCCPISSRSREGDARRGGRGAWFRRRPIGRCLYFCCTGTLQWAGAISPGRRRPGCADALQSGHRSRSAPVPHRRIPPLPAPRWERDRGGGRCWRWRPRCARLPRCSHQRAPQARARGYADRSPSGFWIEHHVSGGGLDDLADHGAFAAASALPGVAVRRIPVRVRRGWRRSAKVRSTSVMWVSSSSVTGRRGWRRRVAGRGCP